MALEALTQEEMTAMLAEHPALFSGQGRAGLTLDQVVHGVSELSLDDLAEGAQAKANGAATPVEVLTNGPAGSGLTQLRTRHHRLAQLIAGGMLDKRAGVLCGYNPNYVAQLRKDPAFQELLAHYGEQVDEEFSSFVSAAAQLSEDLLDHLRDLMDGGKLGAMATVEAIKTLADRTGNGPVIRQQNLNVNVSMGDRLAAARARVQQANAQVALPAPEPTDAQFTSVGG